MAAADFFKWQLKGDTEAEAQFIGNPPGLEEDEWEIEHKNF